MNEDLGLLRIVDNIDILVVEFPDNGVDADAFHADACPNGVDTVIVRLDGHLGAFSRLSRNLFDLDDAVVNFGDFHLKQLG